MPQRAFFAKFLVISSLFLFIGCFLSYAAEQTGLVRSGPTPIRFSSVTLYGAANSLGAAPEFLGSTQSDANGFFSIDFTLPSDDRTVLYIIADGGIPATSLKALNAPSPAIRLATVLGSQPIASGVIVNERTTVAAAYALAQFISGPEIGGKSPGLQNAVATMMNLVNPTTGEVGAVLGTAPNGSRTSTMREFNSLANLLASCVDAVTWVPCKTLFALATPRGESEPRDTLQAAVDIAHNPARSPLPLFLLSKVRTPYRPTLLLPPDAWTLAIAYEGNGREFDGPGNMAIDKDGNVWITNNYQYSKSPFTCASGGLQLLKLTPSGQDAPGAPYTGGGLYGAGFGITLDPGGNVWVGNFGFQGTENGIPCNQNPPLTSVSLFNSNGTALSPPKGFTQGNISKPQGTVSDQQGNIWIANCGNDSVTQFPGGNPARAINFHDLGLLRPFGLAIDGGGNAWIASSGNNSVVGLDPQGKVIGSPIAVGVAPLGVAVDSLGNVWATNSGVVKVPCTDQGGLMPPSTRPTITEIDRSGGGATARSFTGGGLTIPWGIAVDGDDNIWVANFAGRRLSEFCGASVANCPEGDNTGDPISPRSGFTSNALTRNTGVAIDSSGNVWLANNWLTAAVQTNPGGHAMVVFVGLAAPVKTPMIGPPHRP